MKNQQLATAKPPSAALAVAQPSSPKEASVTKPSDLQRVGRLLEAFDASALGEGDLAAGANVLAAMAISLANVQRPRTCLMTTDGAGLAVGTSRRDLQRRFVCFTADERDEVLESLAADGLLELDTRRVRAVPLAGFIGSLSSRTCLGEPELRCPALLEEWESAKAPQTVGRG